MLSQKGNAQSWLAGRRFMFKGRQPDPTAAEIAEATAKIRATWTKAERRKRTVTPNPRATTNVVTVADLNAAAQAARR